jgi:hypothetical protein
MLESNLDRPTGIESFWSFDLFGRGYEPRINTHTKALLTILSHHPVARGMPIYTMSTSSSFL